MIQQKKEMTDYLERYSKGLIKKGLGIGCQLDDYLRFKRGTFNITLGHDNVGKTYWRMWYYLCLAVKHNLKFCIWSGENHAGQIIRDLVQQFTGRPFKELSLSEVYRYTDEILQWFTFVDNKTTYKYEDLLKLFEDSGEFDCCMIDPYTGLNRDYTHKSNYDFLNQTREWVNNKKITVDICTHPVSASARGAISYYPKGHEWAGSLVRPRKDDTEGGKPFANRCDDFTIVHRISDQESMRYHTLIYIDKIKDIETGGKRTTKETPVTFDYNFGLGFKCEGVDPLRDAYVKPIEGYQPKPLPVNKSFYEPKENDFNGDTNTELPF